MFTASLFFGLIVALAFWAVTRNVWKTNTGAFRAFFCVFVLAGLSGLVLNAKRYAGPPKNGPPRKVTDAGYVSSNNCRSCHIREFETWRGSYHRSMTQLPSREAILAPFDGKEISVEGVRYRPFQRDGEYWFEQFSSDVEDAGPPSAEHKVVLTTGSHHMQLYWRDGGRGRLLHLPIVYLVAEKRWIPRAAAFILPTACAESATDERHAGKWNIGCIECHSTHGRPQVLDNGATDTQVSDFGISCEACHGPAEKHMLAYQNPLRRYFGRSSSEEQDKNDKETLIANPSRMSKARSAEVCGQCHSVQIPNSKELYAQWNGEGHVYRPGDKLLETRFVVSPEKRGHPTMTIVETKDPQFVKNTYWSDGMIRVTGREFNGLSHTKCFVDGEMTCLSCHTMHAKEKADDPSPGSSLADFRKLRDVWADDQLAPGMRGNQACLQCHEKMAKDTSAHTHHPVGSAGDNCYNCHMPHTTYGLLKSVRSHEIDSPRVATTVATGRPNACNLCHVDQPLAWTAEHLSSWYGQEAVKLDEDTTQVADTLLGLLTGDAAQRALAAAALGRDEPMEAAKVKSWAAPFLAQRLDDPYPAVRMIALKSLRRQPGFADFDFDVVGSPEMLQEAKRKALQIWNDNRPSGDRVSPFVLLDDQGKLKIEQLERLNSLRDDSDVTLIE